MSVLSVALPILPKPVVDAALDRLGEWESSVERPQWQIPAQQLRFPPSTPSHFSVHQDRPEQLLRFRSCQRERQFWLEHLPNIEPDQMRISRFRHCGAFAWVASDSLTGALFLRGESCKLRICPVCRRTLQRRSARRVLDFMDSHPDRSWQFQTFTLKHSQLPLSDQLARLVHSFRKLRQRKLWRASVSTGYAVIEVTFHPRGSVAPGNRIRDHSEWHPHLHVLAATTFIDWSQLRAAWKSVTGDSDNIDCQLVTSSTQAAHYVSKYIGKPPDLNLRNDPPRAREYYRALQHRRLLMPFGSTTKHRAPPPPPPSPSHLLCRFDRLLSAAANGDYPASCTLAHLILCTTPRPSPCLQHPHNLLFPPAPT